MNSVLPPFEQLPTVTDLSFTGVEEACRVIQAKGPSYRFDWTLRVNSYMERWAGDLLRNLGQQQQGNPLAPYVNLAIDDRLPLRAWYIEGERTTQHGRPSYRVGSDGVS